MRKCSRDAVLGAVLCACSAAAWAGPIDLPAPGAISAAAPQPASSKAPAYGSPGASTGTAPAAATAPPASTAGKPAAATPPPPKPKGVDYSHLDLTAFQEQPFGKQDIGHGQRLTVSDALSEGAFFDVDGERRNSDMQLQHRFDVGVGINTFDDPSRSFYTMVDWTGIGIHPNVGSGLSGHGYAVIGGIRVLVLQSVELDTEARFDSNPALDGHLSGEIGLFYEFYNKLWLGLDIATDSQENDYLLTLRWTY